MRARWFRPSTSCIGMSTALAGDANKVRIAGRFAYELLDALKPKKSADAAPSAPLVQQ